MTLSNSIVNTPTFTAPVVTYPPDEAVNLQFSLTVTSSRGPVSVADNVTVTVKWAFLDDFSTDTTDTYSTDRPWGVPGPFSYSGSAASVTTGVSNSLAFEHAFGPGLGASEGVFAFNFTPTGTYGGGGDLEVPLGEDYNTCYLSTSTG